MNDKTVVILGGKGFIGSALRRHFLSKGYVVVSTGRRHGDPHERSYNEACMDWHIGAGDNHYYRLDISDAMQVNRFAKLMSSCPNRISCVYNCAAEFGRYNGEDFYDTLWNSNVVGLKNILNYFPWDRIDKFVHFSSSEVYGDTNDRMHEHLLDLKPVTQLNDYAISKRVNELQIKNFIELSKPLCDKTFTCVRLFNVYGPGEPYSPYRSALRRWIHCLLNKQRINIYAYHKRSWMYISDAIELLYNIGMRSDVHSPIVNVGTKESYYMQSIAKLLIYDMFKIPNYFDGIKSKERQTTVVKRIDNSIAEFIYFLQCQVNLVEGLIKTIVSIAESDQYPMTVPLSLIDDLQNMDKQLLLEKLQHYELETELETRSPL